MITPRFKIEQTEDTVVIRILAPYTDIKKTEITVLEEDVRFYSAPYYLRLNLPGKVEEGDNSSATYDADKLTFVVTLDKMTPGQLFENLDMLTTMLLPKVDQPSASTPLIEVMSSSGDSDMEPILIDCNEWFINQVLQEDQPSEQLLQKYKYGFGSRHSGLGTKYEIELAQVCEIKNPDSLSPNQRMALQEEDEDEKFSDDHYFQDLMETDMSPFLDYKLDISKFLSLNDSDRHQLKDISNREFLFDKTEQMQLFLGVVDIIFAFLYDTRINSGKSCIESQWNISRLSSSLSYFQVFNNMEVMIRSSIRRSLICPLYRHWDLSLQVLKDTHNIIAAGNVPILKCFLGVRKLFSKQDPYYLLNQLYINEYCVWIQQASTENWHSLADGLSMAICNLKKEHVGFDLIYLDIAAQATQDECMEEEMSQQISAIAIQDEVESEDVEVEEE